MAVTDLPLSVQNSITRSSITEVYVLGRRGPIEANFTNANLFEADFTGANILNANFEGSNLNNATWADGKKCELNSIGKCISK